MRVATWNINSVRTRIDRAVAFLERNDVDVLAMQETKCSDDKFPYSAFEAAGYDVAHAGYHQWNGVAIISRVGLENVRDGFELVEINIWLEVQTAESVNVFHPVSHELDLAGPPFRLLRPSNQRREVGKLPVGHGVCGVAS